PCEGRRRHRCRLLSFLSEASSRSVPATAILVAVDQDDHDPALSPHEQLNRLLPRNVKPHRAHSLYYLYASGAGKCASVCCYGSLETSSLSRHFPSVLLWGQWTDETP